MATSAVGQCFVPAASLSEPIAKVDSQRLLIRNGLRHYGSNSNAFAVARRVRTRQPTRKMLVMAMQADDSPPSEMSVQSALDLLGVKEGASFDEILTAKRAVIAKCSDSQEKMIQVEAAYDLLLMQSLSRRRSGAVVDNSIRFADVRKPKPASQPAPEWLQKAASVSPVKFEQPASNDLAIQAAVFGALAAWTLAGGLGQGDQLYGAPTDGSDVPGLQLALGFGASIYFLRQQSVKLGKSFLITGGGLVIGTILGSVMQAWLRVDIFPILGVGSPAVLVSEFTFLSLWFSSAYLR